MKTFVITSMILTMALQAANTINAPMTLPTTANVTVLQVKSDKELAWVDEQIQAILPARIGVADGYINSLNDPIKYASSAPVAGANGISFSPLNWGACQCFGDIIVAKVVEEPLRLQG
jgi:hypothetical protein